MTVHETGWHKDYGDYSHYPYNELEGYTHEKHHTNYMTTNALVFPLKLIDDEEVLRGDDLSGEIQD